MQTGSLLTHLECSLTGEQYDAGSPQNLSAAGAPLLARYDLTKPIEESSLPGLWKYAPVLPVRDTANIAFLGEGWTPLLNVEETLLVKEESVNPTGSFKARGMAVAVARAKELGATELAVGTAGNAGSALAAYAAALGLNAHIAMPRDTPAVNIAECRALGAEVQLVDGLITDANALIQQGVKEHGWFDVATLREPYRLEGKKTMGYEVFEQMGRKLPDVIIYPTGGGTGLIGMWKAFAEMAELGWIGPERPRMVCVQAAGCAPMVRAFEAGLEKAAMWENAVTMASGLRVPRAIGDFLILRALRESGGTAISVSEEEIYAAWTAFSARTGVFAAPEGAATYAAYLRLRDSGWIKEGELVVLFNTGAGIKYMEAWNGRPE
jgi:threonine synthase